MNETRDAVREAFLRAERALRPLTDAEKRRVIRAFTVLLEDQDPTGDRPNG